MNMVLRVSCSDEAVGAACLSLAWGDRNQLTDRLLDVLVDSGLANHNGRLTEAGWELAGDFMGFQED